jgi:hypothetical protein
MEVSAITACLRSGIFTPAIRAIQVAPNKNTFLSTLRAENEQFYL